MTRRGRPSFRECRGLGGGGKVSIEILNQIRRSERESEEIVARARENARAMVERERGDSAGRIEAAHDAAREHIRSAVGVALSEAEEEIARREEDVDRECEALRSGAQKCMPEVVATIIERIMG